jgi:hypothetical protein
VFPAKFLAEAQALRRQRTIAFQLRQRAALVCLLHQEPEISHPEAAAAMHMPIDWIRRWRRRWALGDWSLEDKPGRGRKLDFSPSRSSRGASHRL